MPRPDDDGLDSAAWQRLGTVVLAAASGDRRAFEVEIRRWPSGSSLLEQQRIGLYLFAAVKYLVKVFVQGDPSEADLKSLATSCFPDVEEVLAAHPIAVEDALRTVFRMPFIRRKLRPDELLVLDAAIAGCLLNQLGAELREVREWVAEWWKVNAEAARAAGLQ